ncbi:S1C family serine protease [Aciditerrimonas ferrireducens]|uniref:S1C family serine protease n=1 Tax=Aciditerrimonas ferrireducens TaxID=667306 RepID=A0ABV6C5U6_9ACTN
MASGDPFTDGELPEDQGDDEPLRGWLPPEDRLWRHPSELANQASPERRSQEGLDPSELPPLDETLAELAAANDPSPGDHPLLGARPFDAGRPGAGRLGAGRAGAGRAGPVRLGPVRLGPGARTVTALVALVALLALVSATGLRVHGSGQPEATLVATPARLTTDTTVAPAPQVSATLAGIQRSLVGVLVDEHGHREMLTGVVIGRGHLVLTAAPGLLVGHGNGDLKVSVLDEAGRLLPATVLGVDPTSGVAALAVKKSLVPARLTNRRLSPGTLTMTTCLCQRQGDTVAPVVAVGRVEAVGVRAPDGHGTLLDALETDAMPSHGAPLGGVLVDGTGAVAGVLAGQTTSRGELVDVFVPAHLAAGVAEELAAHHAVTHGWLGVMGTSLPGGCGALVTGVVSGMPASTVLAAGDVIEAVDGRSVCDWPELQASLYVQPAGQLVTLEVRDGTAEETYTVALSGSPG